MHEKYLTKLFTEASMVHRLSSKFNSIVVLRRLQFSCIYRNPTTLNSMAFGNVSYTKNEIYIRKITSNILQPHLQNCERKKSS